MDDASASSSMDENGSREECDETEEVQEHEHGDDQRERHRAIELLVLFSVLMCVVPLATMFLVQRFLRGEYRVHLHISSHIADYFGMDSSTAILYGGIVGAVVACVIAGIFAYIAYRDETISESKKQQ